MYTYLIFNKIFNVVYSANNIIIIFLYLLNILVTNTLQKIYIYLFERRSDKIKRQSYEGKTCRS